MINWQLGHCQQFSQGGRPARLATQHYTLATQTHLGKIFHKPDSGSIWNFVEAENTRVARRPDPIEPLMAVCSKYPVAAVPVRLRSKETFLSSSRYICSCWAAAERFAWPPLLFLLSLERDQSCNWLPSHRAEWLASHRSHSRPSLAGNRSTNRGNNRKQSHGLKSSEHPSEYSASGWFPGLLCRGDPDNASELHGKLAHCAAMTDRCRVTPNICQELSPVGGDQY